MEREEGGKMTYRPAIGVYLNGEMIDIRIYEEWSAQQLIMEAVSIVAFLSGCKSFEEYHYKRYGTVLRGLEIDLHRKINKETRGMIDRLIIADLTLKNIYCHWHPLSEKELDIIHEPDEPYTWEEFLKYEKKIHPQYFNGLEFMIKSDYLNACEVRQGRYGLHMTYIMRYYRIDLRSNDLNHLQRLYANDADFRDGVSSSMNIQMLRNLN